MTAPPRRYTIDLETGGSDPVEDPEGEWICADTDSAAAFLAADPVAAARFVVGWMERETGLPFGDMIGRLDAERIAALTGLERGASVPGPRRIAWPVCADCFRHIEPGSTEGHLSWCPFAGDPEFPRLAG